MANNDRAYHVSWEGGQIIVHAATEESAIDVALRYLKVRESGRIRVQPYQPEDTCQPKT